jgi:uncharacterized protein (TIGR02677 family)
MHAPDESSADGDRVPPTAGECAEQLDPQRVSDRLSLYRYATADEHAVTYIALMRLFTSSLLVDLSAAEAAHALRDAGIDLSADVVQARCEQLERWGNVVRSVRDARVTTVSEYRWSRSRFQVSKLGGRVHRQVEDVLRAGEGAREVARELLGGAVATLDRILARLDDHVATGAPMDADALAGDVTSVFTNHQLFTDSVRDFYAYLNHVLARYDLAGAEYAQFKTLLLEYVDLITADVARHAPALTTRLLAVMDCLDPLLETLASLPALTGPDGTPAERSPGRDRQDWEALTAWYGAESGRSGPDMLRGAADRALGQLITNARRILATAGTGVSRHSDFIRLARWFEAADADTAHRIFDAAFGAYPARHVFLGPDHDLDHTVVTTSWWDADPVDVPLSLRERGDRTPRGRNAPVPDPGLEREQLLAEAEEEERARRAAGAELLAAARLNGAVVSPAARDLVLALLGDLLAANQDLRQTCERTEPDLGLALRVTPGPGATVLMSDDGRLVVHGLSLTVVADTIAGDLLDDTLEARA